MFPKVVPLYRQDAGHPQAAVCAACEVRRSALFGALDEAALDRVHTHIAAPEFAPDQRLYARGDPASAVYTLRTGIVRFERVTEGGARRIVRLAGRGDLIGLEALVQQPYADDAIACTPVQVCRIPRALVDHLGETESGLLREVMRRWQRALEDAEAWVADLATGAARRRVLKLLALLDRHADAGGLFWMPRREDMGAMLDMTVEHASRVISQLRREGVIVLLPPRAARVDRAALTGALRAQDAD
jgi:CRP/FNR family transcriptional regulator